MSCQDVRVGLSRSAPIRRASAIPLHEGDKAVPSRSEAPATRGVVVPFQENARARLAKLIVPAWPMHVRDDVLDRNVEAARESGGEARRPVDCGFLPRTISEFADFDSDAQAIARAAVVGVITLLRGEQVFHGFAIIDGEMPRNPSRPAKSRVVFAALALCKQIMGMLRRSCVDLLSRMNRNVLWSHRASDQPAMNIGRQEREANTRQLRSLIAYGRAVSKQQAGARHISEEEKMFRRRRREKSQCLPTSASTVARRARNQVLIQIAFEMR
jgi:hypothetical protein